MRKKITHFIFVIVLIPFINGCLSYNTYQNSKSEVVQRRAIVAQKLGDDGVGIGVNLLDVEALSLHPWKQFWSACGDALMVWGAAEATKYVQNELLNQDDNNESDAPSGDVPVGNVIDSSDGSDGSSGANNITINGNYNSVTIKLEKQ